MVRKSQNGNGYIMSMSTCMNQARRGAGEIGIVIQKVVGKKKKKIEDVIKIGKNVCRNEGEAPASTLRVRDQQVMMHQNYKERNSVATRKRKGSCVVRAQLAGPTFTQRGSWKRPSARLPISPCSNQMPPV